MVGWMCDWVGDWLLSFFGSWGGVSWTICASFLFFENISNLLEWIVGRSKIEIL